MRVFIKTMKALADPSRAKIIKMLQKREMCVCEIKTALGLAQPTVSKHLKVLEEADLVERWKEGLYTNYRLSAGASPYGEVLLAHLRGWLDQDPEIQALLAKIPQIDRENICSTERKKTTDRLGPSVPSEPVSQG